MELSNVHVMTNFSKSRLSRGVHVAFAGRAFNLSVLLTVLLLSTGCATTSTLSQAAHERKPLVMSGVRLDFASLRNEATVTERFGVSPPTALIIDEPFLFAAVQQHLARRGILAPEHVSLICIDNDPSFSWLHPSVAHLAWNPDQVLRKVGRWAEKVARGEIHHRQSFSKAKFVEGGTIGPAP